MDRTNNRFVTQDLCLACFLKVRGVRLIRIIPLAYRESAWEFENPPEGLIQEWISGQPEARIRVVISEYRHLLSDTKRAEREASMVMSERGSENDQ